MKNQSPEKSWKNVIVEYNLSCVHYNLPTDQQHCFTIINFTVKDIDSALYEPGVDIEDNIQFVLARKQKQVDRTSHRKRHKEAFLFWQFAHKSQ